jgi:hypothetical protein
MSKFSQKPTSDKQAKTKMSNAAGDKISLEKKVINKFAGMAKGAVMVEPVIIPGYKIRG